ncbi:hypothetical protein MYXE_33460 [Mycobacterium xenopi]|uniref:PE domain-containing protein n=1 Tax=Mycobacterium xenopi TaxID=1789 RepID=A0AAD1M2M2_MYCXE|nr:hypothetical protein MYXE_33460 [Mycobacterium xenopi]
MSFVKTLPEALAAASSQLEGLGTSMAAESAAAAGPTTAIAPAASDEVSALQAGIFSTYGQLYQTASAQAQAIHQQFVNLLAASAGSYGETEAANQAVAASTPLTGLSSLVGASPAAAPTQATGLGDILEGLAQALGNSPLSSPIANLLNINTGNWASAGSDLIGMAGGGLLTALPEEAAEGGLEGGLADLAGTVSPAGAAVPRRWAPHRCWPGSGRHRRSGACRSRPVGPAKRRRPALRYAWRLTAGRPPRRRPRR